MVWWKNARKHKPRFVGLGEPGEIAVNPKQVFMMVHFSARSHELKALSDDHQLTTHPSASYNGSPPLRHTRIAILGAGFSGLGMAIRLKQAGQDDFAVIERAADLGGTWRDNTYPG